MNNSIEITWGIEEDHEGGHSCEAPLKVTAARESPPPPAEMSSAVAVKEAPARHSEPSKPEEGLEAELRALAARLSQRENRIVQLEKLLDEERQLNTKLHQELEKHQHNHDGEKKSWWKKIGGK